LDVEALRTALVVDGPLSTLEVLPTTGSTNTELVNRMRRAHSSVADRLADHAVLVAEEQTSGRGRNARSWCSPRGAGLYFSVALYPTGVPAARLTWVPLLAGVAVAEVVRRDCGVHAGMKWPNDLLVGPERRKCGGILAELVTGGGSTGVVVGIGVNVAHTVEELPATPGGLPATSLMLAGARCLDRDLLLTDLLTAFVEREQAWRAVGGDPVRSGLLAAYRTRCATIGARVVVEFPAGDRMRATALDVDTDGRLLVRCDNGKLRAVSAGDVMHVRPETAVP
jgi:BirA family biotin operon repressor/biotin-[acetyl-CoA-carboxylase] ligase